MLVLLRCWGGWPPTLSSIPSCPHMPPRRILQKFLGCAEDSHIFTSSFLYPHVQTPHICTSALEPALVFPPPSRGVLAWVILTHTHTQAIGHECASLSPGSPSSHCLRPLALGPLRTPHPGMRNIPQALFLLPAESRSDVGRRGSTQCKAGHHLHHAALVSRLSIFGPHWNVNVNPVRAQLPPYCCPPDYWWRGPYGGSRSDGC